MLWRQGDVYIVDVPAIPESARLLDHCVLAEGEATGHCHRIMEADRAELFELDGVRFLAVTTAQVTLVHDEHAPITLPPGNYRFWLQREYSPRGNLPVLD